MNRTRLATEQDMIPAGMRCPYCGTDINVGDEFVETLEGMVEDIPLVLSGICPSCAERVEKFGLLKCSGCDGSGEQDDAQCSDCGGMGEVIRSGHTNEHD